MAKIAVIGSGFSSLSAASYLAKAGHSVTIVEKNDSIGGRCRQFKVDGFTFDMGPSWYWMPEVFENFFADFNHKVSDFYTLKRLSPSYTIHFSKTEQLDVPSDFNDLVKTFEEIEIGAGQKLIAFMEDASKKYEAGMNRFVVKPSLSIFEFADFEILKGLVQLDLFKAFSKHVRNYFTHPHLIQLLEFPVLFLGATPQEIPALYSLMNFADLKGGTWYPDKGMFKIIAGMAKVAEEQGVEIKINSTVEEIIIDASTKKATGIKVNNEILNFDYIVAGADYEHVDQKLVPQQYRNYTEEYWDKRKMAPSSLLYYLGINKKLDKLHHHNLFFDSSFDAHAKEIYDTKKWPEDPLFYVCAPSLTDASVAPEGCENLFLLVPLAPDLEDSEAEREKIFQKIMKRLENFTGQEVEKHIIYKRSFAMNDFKQDYNAFKGNAYGLANTLWQTAFMKPQILNKKVKNLYYTGQLTVPGPGVPPSIISGKVVANHLLNSIKA
jgi:phytoene desaturase